jgi:hypothetical protein
VLEPGAKAMVESHQEGPLFIFSYAIRCRASEEIILEAIENDYTCTTNRGPMALVATIAKHYEIPNFLVALAMYTSKTSRNSTLSEKIIAYV